LPILDEIKLEKEMEGCTFQPQVNPVPPTTNVPIPIAMKNPDSFNQIKPIIDNLI
jgi:hypothetical protein